MSVSELLTSFFKSFEKALKREPEAPATSSGTFISLQPEPVVEPRPEKPEGDADKRECAPEVEQLPIEHNRQIRARYREARRKERTQERQKARREKREAFELHGIWR